MALKRSSEENLLESAQQVLFPAWETLEASAGKDIPFICCQRSWTRKHSRIHLSANALSYNSIYGTAEPWQRGLEEQLAMRISERMLLVGPGTMVIVNKPSYHQVAETISHE